MTTTTTPSVTAPPTPAAALKDSLAEALAAYVRQIPDEELTAMVAGHLLTRLAAGNTAARRPAPVHRSAAGSPAGKGTAEKRDNPAYRAKVATRVLAIVRRRGAPASEAWIVRRLGKSQQGAAAATIAEMLQSDRLAVVAVNGWGKGMYDLGPAATA